MSRRQVLSLGGFSLYAQQHGSSSHYYQLQAVIIPDKQILVIKLDGVVHNILK